MRRPPFFIRFAVILLALLALPSLPTRADSKWEVSAPGRVVVFGDVHGAYEELIRLLRQADIIDDSLNWRGGNTHLVSLGDLVDRGPQSRMVMDLLMQLQEQAPGAGGAVHVVMGNHELMVSSGDWRYVSGAEFGAFAGEEDEQKREQVFEQWRRDQSGRGEASTDALRAEFDEKFPPGFVALRRAYGPDGRYGQWMRANPAVLKVNDTIFMHGGISPAAAQQSLKSLNAQLGKELQDYDEANTGLGEAGVLPVTMDFWERRSHAALTLQSEVAEAQARGKRGKRALPDWYDLAVQLEAAEKGLIFQDDSPLWYRGSVYCHPYGAGYDVEQALARWGAQRVIVGHTPTRDARIHSRMDGRLIMADTGMLAAVYRGRPSAVVIDGDSINAIYAGEPGFKAIDEEQRHVASQPLDDAAMEQFLLTAPVVETEDIGIGISGAKRITLDDGTTRARAIYKIVDSSREVASSTLRPSARMANSDRYIHDLAAYRLDRLLNLQMVPVSVLRDIDGRSGLVQTWIEDSINELQRREEEMPYRAACSEWVQYRPRIVFDILIHNDDRNLTNLLWTKKDFQLWLIDHSRSFRLERKRPDIYRKANVELSDGFRARLEALNHDMLHAALGDILHPRQINMLLERRDDLLKEHKPLLAD